MRGRRNTLEQQKQSKEKTHKCSCGKTYSSKPAVYCHIKNKHDNDKVNYKVIDLSKGEQGSSRAFRLEQIKFSEKQANLITLAETTACLKIAEMLETANLKIDAYFLDDSFLSDSQQEQANHEEVQKSQQKYLIKQGQKNVLAEVKKQFKESLDTFKIGKFYLNIRWEISKFFKFDFAWKIETQIILHFAKMCGYQQQIINACQRRLWKPEEERMKTIIEVYCSEWQRIRNSDLQ